MNSLISGQIGAGKTYYAVKNFVIPALQSGRFVYTNIDFGHKYIFDIWSKFSNYLNKDISKFINVITETRDFLELLKLQAYHEKGSRLPYSSVVVIDEAHQIFNYLDVNKVPKQVYEFLAYSRHFNIDLVFISQSPELLSKFIMNLCNNYIYIENFKNYSRLMKKSYRVVVYPSYFKQVAIESKVESYDEKIFSLYRSYVENEGSVFKRPILPEGWQKPAFGFGLVALFLFWSLSRGGGYFKLF